MLRFTVHRAYVQVEEYLHMLGASAFNRFRSCVFSILRAEAGHSSRSLLGFGPVLAQGRGSQETSMSSWAVPFSRRDPSSLYAGADVDFVSVSDAG